MPRPGLAVPALFPVFVLMSLCPAADAQAGRFRSPARRLPYQVYYAEGSSNPLDLGRTFLVPDAPVETLAAGEGILGRLGIALDAENCFLYVPQRSPDHDIVRFNTDGTGRTVILDYTTAVGPEGVALDAPGGRLYIISPGVATRIRSCKLDGSDPRDLVGHADMSGGVSPDSIHFDPLARRFYWWDTAFQGFRAGLVDANDDVGCLKNLYQTGIATSYEVDVVNGYLYWSVNSGSTFTLFRAAIPADGPDPCDSSSCDATTCPPETFVVDTTPFGSRSLSVLAENASGAPEKGVVVWRTGNSSLRWRSLQGAWPVPVYQANPPVEAGLIGAIEVGSGVTMCAALAPPEGGRPLARRLAVTIKGGEPGALFLLRAVELDGSPFEARLHAGRLDEDGSRTLPLPVPSSLSGREVRLEALVTDENHDGVRRRTTARLP